MSTAAAYYIVMTCRNCDEDIYYGLCVTTLEHNGRPVIPFDIAAQTSFFCDRCGADNYTGDFEVEYEGGTDPDELGDASDDDSEADVGNVAPETAGNL